MTKKGKYLWNGWTTWTDRPTPFIDSSVFIYTGDQVISEWIKGGESSGGLGEMEGNVEKV